MFVTAALNLLSKDQSKFFHINSYLNAEIQSKVYRRLLLIYWFQVESTGYVSHERSNVPFYNDGGQPETSEGPFGVSKEKQVEIQCKF